MDEARVTGNDGPVGILGVERWQERRVNDAQFVLLSEKSLLVDNPKFNVVNSLDIGDVTADAGVG